MSSNALQLIPVNLRLFDYKKDVDYQSKINQAVSEGNYQAAALYEQQRNEKIAGENLNYKQTNKYSSYLNSGSGNSGSGGTGNRNAGGSSSGLFDANTDYSALINAAMNNNSTDRDYLQQLLNARIAKENSAEFSKYANPDYDAQVQAYINSIQTGPDWKSYFDEAMAQINAMYEAPTYTPSKFDTLKEQLATKALNMEYDDWLNSDQYKALVNRYGLQGQQSMRDVLGQISSRTGGLASSFAASAAQQQYNDYMAQLEAAAQDMYAAEQQSALNKANAAYDYADSDYQRYLDELAQWGNDRSFAYDVLSDAIANSRYDQEWQNTLQQQALSNQRTTQGDAQDRIGNYLAAGGAAANLDPSLVASSGYTTAELAALEKYYAGQASRSTGSSGSGAANTDADGTQTSGSRWADVESWALRYGADSAEDYIKEHYKDMGYGSQSAALAGWNNHMLEIGGMSGLQSSGNNSGYNESLFAQAMRSIASALASGTVPDIASLQGKLNAEQQRQLEELISRYGYSLEVD